MSFSSSAAKSRAYSSPQEEIADLKKQLDEVSAIARDLEEKNRTLKNENHAIMERTDESYEASMEGIRKQEEEHVRVRHQAYLKLEGLEKSIAQKDNKIEKLGRDIDDLKDKLLRAKGESKIQARANQSAEDALTSAVGESKKVKSDLEAANKRLSSLETDLGKS